MRITKKLIPVILMSLMLLVGCSNSKEQENSNISDFSNLQQLYFDVAESVSEKGKNSEVDVNSLKEKYKVSLDEKDKYCVLKNGDEQITINYTNKDKNSISEVIYNSNATNKDNRSFSLHFDVEDSLDMNENFYITFINSNNAVDLNKIESFLDKLNNNLTDLSLYKTFMDISYDIDGKNNEKNFLKSKYDLQQEKTCLSLKKDDSYITLTNNVSIKDLQLWYKKGYPAIEESKDKYMNFNLFVDNVKEQKNFVGKYNESF